MTGFEIVPIKCTGCGLQKPLSTVHKGGVSVITSSYCKSCIPDIVRRLEEQVLKIQREIANQLLQDIHHE